jgi:hypothetical protein
MEGRAAKSQGRGQGLAACLAASGTSLQSDSSSGPSSPATPPDERPKGRSDIFSRLGPMPAPTSWASSHQVGCRQLLGQQLLCLAKLYDRHKTCCKIAVLQILTHTPWCELLASQPVYVAACFEELKVWFDDVGHFLVR